MNILYLTQWFDPEPGVIKGPAFVRALTGAGHRVTVVTGIPNYPSGRVYPGYRIRLFQRETIAGVEVVRLPLYPSHDSSSVRRGLNFLSFFVSAFCYGMLRAGRHDLAYVYHPPITVGLAAALFGRLRGLPYVLEIQDLWPDTVAASGMAGAGRLARILDAICNFVYRRADHIVVQSAGMRRLLIERGVPAEKLSVIRNWADEAALAPPSRAGRNLPWPRGRFTFVYGGNLGRAQALAHVVRAAKLAEERGGQLDLILIGDGVEAGPLRALAEEIGAANVRFLDRVPKTEVAGLFAEADVLVMHLADHGLFEATIPSKTQFYLAMGKPILAGVGGEAARILTEAQAAIVVPPCDASAMADAMIELAGLNAERLAQMGKEGRKFYADEMSFEKGMAATLDVIAKAG